MASNHSMQRTALRAAADAECWAGMRQHRIFKGAKPSDLPVERSATFELLLNGKTANALHLTIPSELRLRADRVIE